MAILGLTNFVISRASLARDGVIAAGDGDEQDIYFAHHFELVGVRTWPRSPK
jgi:hypothetical protein